MTERFSQIHHPAFSTGDMDATIRFWRDLLGAELVYGYGSPGQRQYFFRLNKHAYVAFFEWDGVQSAAPHHHGSARSGPASFDHLAIGLSSESELWKLVGEFVAAGHVVSDVIDHGFVISCYSHDPNGIALEFCYQRTDYDPADIGLRFDHQSSQVALEGQHKIGRVWPKGEPLSEDEKVIVPGEGHDHFETS